MELLDQKKVTEEKNQKFYDFQEIVKKYPSGAILTLALYLKEQGFPEKGASLLLLAIRKNPEHWQLYDFLVFLSLKTQETKEAEKTLLETQAIFPENPYIYASLGKLYFFEEKFIQAKKVLGKSLELNSEDGAIFLFLALCRLALYFSEEKEDQINGSEILEIEQELQKFKELNPELLDDEFIKGESFLSKRNFSEAFKSFQQTLTAYGSDKLEFTNFHKLLRAFYFEPEKIEPQELKGHIYELERKLKSSPSSTHWHNELGCSYLLFSLNLIKSAEEQLKKGLVLDPGFETASKASSSLEEKKEEIISLLGSIRF